MPQFRKIVGVVRYAGIAKENFQRLLESAVPASDFPFLLLRISTAGSQRLCRNAMDVGLRIVAIGHTAGFSVRPIVSRQCDTQP